VGRIAAGLIGLVALSAVSASSSEAKIYNGERASFHSYRFMVSLRTPRYPNHHFCAGTLIAPKVVLTAAHCVAGRDATKLIAVVGVNRPGWRHAKRVRVNGYRRPPHSSVRKNNRNDLALLRLAKRQTTPVVRLAEKEPKSGARTTLAGWGCTDKPPKCRHHARGLEILRQRVVPDSRCGRSIFYNPPAYAPSSVCARASHAVGSFGDSGGPQLVGHARTGFTQVGVASLLSDKPKTYRNSYTSVASLRGWIDRASAALSR
jgi:trypsin